MQYRWSCKSKCYRSWYLVALLLVAVSAWAQPDVIPPPGGGGGGGSGDITDVYNCSTGNCSSIALTDGDYLDMSAVNASGAEGLRLPQAASCATTTEGIVCWNTSTNALYIGNGEGGVVQTGDITSVFNCTSGACSGFALSDGELINFGSVEVTTTAEGILLPVGDSSGEDCSNGTAEGQICWDTDDDALFLGTDGSVRQMGLITSIFDCTEDNCGDSLAASDGDVIDMTSVEITTTGEGIILPNSADCSSAGGTTEGQVCWDTAGDMLYVGTSGGVTAMGDITDVFSCASGDCSSITVADGDLLNFSGVTVSSTTEGIILPAATDCSSGTAEGQLCWDTDNDELNVGTSAGVITLGGGGAGDITAVYDCTSMDCSSIAMSDGDFLDMSSVNASGTSEGIILPQNTDCSAATAEGQLCWKSDTDSLFVGDGAAANDISQSSVDLDTAFDNGKVIDGANSQANGFRVGDGTDYWGFYIGTNACVQECVVGGSPSDVEVQIAADNNYVLDLDGTDSLTIAANTGVATLAGDMVEVKPAPFPAGMMVPDGMNCDENTNQTLNAEIFKATITCTNNDNSTMKFNFPAPASWDEATLTITQHMFINDANVDDVVEFDWVGYCAGDNDPWGHGTYTAEDANSVLTFDGSNYAVDDGVSVTTAGNVPIGSCAEGDMVFIQGSVDATATVATSIAELHTLWVDVNISYVNWSD